MYQKNNSGGFIMNDSIIDGCNKIIKRCKSVKGDLSPVEAMKTYRELLEISQEQIISTTEKYSDIVDKHVELSNRYSMIVDEMGESAINILGLFFENPTQALNLFVEQADRKRMIDDQSGNAWKTSLKLLFRHRLKIAFKLIFNSEKIKSQ